MQNDRLKTALDLYKLTQDDLMLDSIRALVAKDTPPTVRTSVEAFVDTQADAYLILFWNSGKHPKHGEPCHPRRPV